MEVCIEEFDIDKIDSKKVIIIFKDDKLLNKLDDVFSELILKEIYPLTYGIPFCRGDAQHMVEVFRKEKKNNNYKECMPCELKEFCAYTGDGFTPKPIINADRDMVKWINDENTADWI